MSSFLTKLTTPAKKKLFFYKLFYKYTIVYEIRMLNYFIQNIVYFKYYSFELCFAIGLFSSKSQKKLNYRNPINKYKCCYLKRKYTLYIRNLKYAHCNTCFWLHNIPLAFSTCPYKFKCILLRFFCTKIYKQSFELFRNKSNAKV